MHKRFDHKEIEGKWQQDWKEKKVYATVEDTSKPKTYVLDMFPYPSGEGLHVGHPKGYIATDIYSRYKRMSGHSVLHPMGWDAFGLPAENYAIKNKVHPRQAVDKNVARFKEQLSVLGFDYDWGREINTTDPQYYKWTQWIFIQLFKKGLAYESNEPINWCPGCQTGLANEDVESDGTCERCSSKVEKRPMRQWVLKIREYADRMLEDLESLNWPEHIKEQQRNWIGRKEGIVVPHSVIGTDIVIETFSAYPAWMFADTFLVVAPEHPLIADLIKGQDVKDEVEAFIRNMATKTALERTEGKEKLGVFTGRYAEDPYRPGVQMPIWVANFALMGFGTGAIRCSGHDERDVDFANKYNIPLKHVVGDGTSFVNAHDNQGILEDSGPFTGRSISSELITQMVEWMVTQNIAARKVTYRIQDWVFSRQRYWGEPIPIIHCEKCGPVTVPEEQLPVTLPEVEQYEPTGTGESPLANIEDWVNTTCPQCGGAGKRETNTMPQWAGSSWYYLRFMDPANSTSLVAPEKEQFWSPVDVYVGGDHAVRHLIYARFWHKFLYDIGVVSTREPFQRLEFLGFILAEDGRKMSKRWGNVINPDEIVSLVGADTLRVYEMFMGPFENTIAWSQDSLAGARRFLERVNGLSEHITDGQESTLMHSQLHKTVKKVREDIEAFKFNTAISAMMVYVNQAEKEGLSKESYLTFLRVLAPFAPHITEELWHQINQSESIHVAAFPTFDSALVLDETVTIGVQINGKLRGEITILREATEQMAWEAVLADPNLAKRFDEAQIKKKVYVPGRILNLIL